MTQSLGLDQSSESLGVFECPNCKEIVDASAQVCRFCGARFDHESAQKASQLLARVDQACSDSSYLRNTIVIVFFLLGGFAYAILRNGRLIERVGFQNLALGFCVLVMLLFSPFPFWSFVWWRKNANLKSDDEDFQNSRKTVRSAGFTAVACFAASAAVLSLILVFKAAH